MNLENICRFCLRSETGANYISVNQLANKSAVVRLLKLMHNEETNAQKSHLSQADLNNRHVTAY